MPRCTPLLPSLLTTSLVLSLLLSHPPHTFATTPSNATSSPLSRLSLFPSPQLHVFFYAWYGAPPHDAGYLHWTHSVLPHWTSAVTLQHRSDPYIAPHDPGVTFHPHRPLYSSHDPHTLRIQMHELASTHTDVVVVSWWGVRHRNTSVDGQGVGSDHCMPDILDAAAAAGLRVAIHLEPYPLRSEYSVREDLDYLFAEYGQHSAFYRHPTTGQGLIYAYDPYHLSVAQWQSLLTPAGALSIRHSPIDCIVLGLVLDSLHDTIEGGFDGMYTYFSADGFTPASTRSRWAQYRQQAEEAGLLFVPAVGPGYDDTRLRPWNGVNRRPRRKGEYYREGWEAAVRSGAQVVSVTSYNEWGEGTQIEPARVFVTDKGERLRGYGETEEGDDDGQEMLYIDLTRQLAAKWKGIADDEDTEASVTTPHAELR